MVTVTSPVSTIRNQVTPMAKKSARKVSKKVTRTYVPAKYAAGGVSKPSSHAWKIADASTHNLDDEVDRSMKKTQFVNSFFFASWLHKKTQTKISTTRTQSLQLAHEFLRQLSHGQHQMHNQDSWFGKERRTHDHEVITSFGRHFL